MKANPMAAYISLANRGGIRLFRNQAATIGASCLTSMGAAQWHKAKPFRKMLVREDSGLCPDDAAAKAWQAGYFGDAADRPDVNDLLLAIERELSGSPVYSTDDAVEIEMEAMAQRNRRDEACEIQHVESKPAAAIEYYERAYTNRKGRAGVQYLAKVSLPGSRKPAFHTVFRCPAERAAAVQSFLASAAA
jgi:hypothetical protein